MKTLYKAKQATHEWVLRIDGKKDIPLVGTSYIGRDMEADICIPDDRISRKHARISVSPGGVMIEDLGSCNGTTVNGLPLAKPLKLKSGDRIKLYVIEFSLLDLAESQNSGLFLRSSGHANIPVRGRLTVGRDTACDISIDDPRISREHAAIALTASGVVVSDLNSINGTYVNGCKIDRPVIVKAGDKIKFHDREFIVDKGLDPDATRFCRLEPDIEATRCDRLIVNGAALEASSTRDEPIFIDKPGLVEEPMNPEKVLRQAHPSPASAPVSNPNPNPNPNPIPAPSSQQIDAKAAFIPTGNQTTPSAIERQISNRHSTVEQKLKSLKLGMWVEFENSFGKRKPYCLISGGEPGETVYSFAKKSGFGIVKRSQQQIESGLRDGSFKILTKRPDLDKAPVFFGGRLSRSGQEAE